MNALLIAAMAEVPVVAAVSLIIARRMLRAHTEALATVAGRKARDVEFAISGAEGRIASAARTGLVARYGPARLKN